LTKYSIFIGSQQTQHVKLYNDDLDHDRQLTRSKHETHGGEDIHLATAMDPLYKVDYSHITPEAGMMMKKPPVVISLSGRVPGRASGPSRSCIDDGGSLQYVSWKIDRGC
jgi:hypothetical protein